MPYAPLHVTRPPVCEPAWETPGPDGRVVTALSGIATDRACAPVPRHASPRLPAAEGRQSALGFGRALGEVLGHARPLSHLARVTTHDVLRRVTHLTSRVPRCRHLPRRRDHNPAFPLTGIAEGATTLWFGRRPLVVAFRLERRTPGSWWCTALDHGPVPRDRGPLAVGDAADGLCTCP